MDDDIEEVHIKSGKSLQTILEESVVHLRESPYGLMGFPPTYNKFWNKAEGFKSGMYYILGAFYVIKNDKTIKIEESIGEDFERSAKYYEKYGANVRNNDLIYKTKCWTNKGGLNGDNGRNKYENYRCLTKLYYNYPHLFRLRTKKMKEELVNLVMKKTDLPAVMVLPTIDIFDNLSKMMKDKMFEKTDETGKGNSGTRIGFKSHYKQCFGLIQPRGKPKGLVLSSASLKYPEVYNELLRIGRILCPFSFQSIHFLKNCVCPPHKDSKNTQKSVLVSFGDYTGCNIVVEGTKYDAKHTPIIFDGRIMEHWNTDDLQGTKYSLVFY
jgi:hypothetical protein